MHISFYEQAVYEKSVKTVKFYLSSCGLYISIIRQENVHHWGWRQSLSSVQWTEKKACFNCSKNTDKKKMGWFIGMKGDHPCIWHLYKGNSYLLFPYNRYKIQERLYILCCKFFLISIFVFQIYQKNMDRHTKLGSFYRINENFKLLLISLTYFKWWKYFWKFYD